MEFRTQRLRTLPLDLLNTTSMMQHEDHREEKTTKKSPEKEKSPEEKRTNEGTSELLDTDVNIGSSLLKEWEQFDQMNKNQNDSQKLTTPKFPIAQELVIINVPIEGEINTPNIQQDIEIIPENPTDEIILKIEEIPPLDVFYSPKHRVVVKRQRKKRKIDQGPLSTPHAEMMNVVWKNS